MRKVLITAIVILALVLAALLGFIWYQSTHVFVDGEAYAKYAQELDLREKEVSESHYLNVKALLPDCRIIWNVPFQGGVQSSDAQQLTITTVNEEDIRILKSYFTDLKQIDANGCSDYAALTVLAQQLPDCDVSYQVSLGGTMAEPKADTLTLAPGSFDFETLMENLAYLPDLKTVSFPTTDLTLDQQTALKDAYPQLEVTSTVTILGQEYDGATTKLDLSSVSAGDVEAVAEKLALLPALSEVDLMGSASVSHLPLEEVKKLKDGAPNASFHYSVDFYGKTVSSRDEEIILEKITVNDDFLAQNIRNLLDVMDGCKRLVLEARGPYDKIWKSITGEELAQIREDYRNKTKVVWRVYFGENGTSLTDAEVIRAVYGLTDDNSKDMVYCENVRFLDVGHNEFLDYMEFLSGMTDLEAAILSGAPLKDLSPIAACKNLKFLEIANCQYIPNIDALKECTQLEMLNISFTKFEDLSPIQDLNLTHLTTVKNAFVAGGEPKEPLQAFIEAHPDCWTVYKGDQPYGKGWRTDEEGKLFGWYAKLEDVFHYSRYAAGGSLNNNVGWYLDKE